MNTKKTSKVVVQRRVIWPDRTICIIESPAIPFEKAERTFYAVADGSLDYVHAIEPRTGLSAATVVKRSYFGRASIEIYSEDIKNLKQALTKAKITQLDEVIERKLKRYDNKELNKHLPR